MPGMSDAQKAEAIRRYGAGETVKGVASGMGFNPRTIRKALGDGGVDVFKKEGRRLYACNERYFQRIDTEGKAYWLGFLTADAHMWRGVAVQLRLNGLDAGHLGKFAAAIGYDGPVTVTNDGRHTARIQVGSRAMVADLAAQGCCHPGTDRHPPVIGGELVRHYLRGLFDGDGGLCDSAGRAGKPHAGISQCGTRACVELFRQWAEAVAGTRAGCHPHRTGIWYFSTTGNRVCRRIADALYDNSTVSLDRKRLQAAALWDF